MVVARRRDESVVGWWCDLLVDSEIQSRKGAHGSMARRVIGGLAVALMAAGLLIGVESMRTLAEYCICDAWWSCWLICWICRL